MRSTHFSLQKIAMPGVIGLALFVFLVTLTSAGSPLANSDDASLLRVKPFLLQIAQTNPNTLVSVIVRKTARDTRAEEFVQALGGQVTQDLYIINSFAAELRARDVSALGAFDGVKYVSYDAPVNQTAGEVTYTTWADTVGTLMPNGFADAANAADSSFGPNGMYASGSNVKGSFTGFSAEVTPGNKISKVELLLQVYTSALLGGGDDPHYLVYVGGRKVKDKGVNHDAFAPFAGAGNAGILAIDLSSIDWKWGDFDAGIEIVVKQDMFKSGSVIYYDAIGLRVTSAPGADSTGGKSPTASSAAPVDAGKQQNAFNAVVRATDVWNTSPYLQGQGITVAVVDSGISKHTDIDKRLLFSVNFNKNYHDGLDYYGHGTFVSSLVAGDGKDSKGAYMGVAPKTNLVNVRVSNDQGQATEADTVAALQWILDNQAKYNIRVVNLSLSASVWESYHTNPLDAAVEILWFNKIVVVVSAGNSGTANLFPPANDPFVITVGATNDLGTVGMSDDIVAPYSGYGTTEVGTRKPELVAPGSNLIAYLPEQNKTTIGREHSGNGVNKSYFRMSGTSMAAPVVAGAVALLLQDEPGLTPDQVKYRLMATADKTWGGYDAAKAGAGYLNIFAAVRGTSTESANTNYPVSQLLFSGIGTVNWNSVNWNNVNWNNVNWNNVNWNNVNWNNDYWGN